MGVKGLHYHARKAEAYDDGIPLLPYLDMEKVDMVYIDACCVFFTLLQTIVGPSLLIYDLKVKKGVDVKGATVADLEKDLTQAVAQFVVELKQSCRRLLSHSRMACLVFDSQTEFGPKRSTSTQRSARANQALNAAKRSYRKRHTRDRVLNYASAYTRFTRAIKGLIFQMLPKYQCHAYDTDNPVPLSFLVADREADAQVVHLADTWAGIPAILSRDGDLFCYGGALNCMRILNVKWEETNLKARTTTKRRLLTKLGLMHEEEKSHEKAEMRLAVVAAVAGNDYAANPKGVGFKTLCNMVKQVDISGQDTTADLLMEKLLEMVSRVYEFEKNRYAAALLQFCRPRVLQASLQDTLFTAKIPISVDSSLSDQMYAPFLRKKVPPGPQEQASRYTPVATLSVPKSFTQPERTDPVQKKASQEKRERGSSSRSLNTPDDPDVAKPRSYKSTSKNLPLGPDGELVAVHPMSRATSTWTAGLASSVLSAAHRRHPEDVDLAVSQARAITSAVRAEVDTANVLRSIALHMARIALHSVATSSVYTLEAKRHIYKNFFQSTRCARASKKLSAQVWEGFATAGQSDSSVSCGQKTWTWIISMATSYEDTRSANLNDLPRGLYSAAAPALDRAAIIANPNNLIAYPQDAAIRSLAGMMSPNPPLRNILLSARHTWWQGYHGHWEDAPKVPSSVSRRPLIETLSRELDSAFRSNIMHNFVPRSSKYYSVLLADMARTPDGWPKDDSFPSFLHDLIHATPLDLPTVSAEIKRRHPRLQARIIKSITTFSRRLRSDSSIDDIRKSLAKKAIAPAGWPQDSAMGAYMAACIYRIPMNGSNKLTADVESVLRVDEMVQKLGARSRARREILNFVNHQRTVLETSCGVRIVARSQKGKAKAVADEMDIYDALGIKRPAANEPSSASQARTKRTKPIDAHHLLALTLFMINTAPSSSSLSFPVTPTTKPKDVSILFSDTCFDVMLIAKGQEKKSPIQFALDISTMASERRGAITLRKRAYCRKLRKTVGNTDQPAFTIGSSFRTDGVRLMVAFINWLKPASEDQWRKHLPEIGSFIRDNDADSLRCITSVIGVDLGEVCPAATFAMPARSELWSQGQQFWFRRREAYGKNSMNARWLEQRKDRAKIFEVESILTQEGVKQSGLPNQSLAYIRALQTGATSAHL
ncbi:hypothetical protein BCR43DRAFT_559548 [Syncephalastrum racemosum]|uniref:Uncharacterized protein n=1 Tax=Syncephalastrum racemosum TaxID=13706 RepID=A0A1X2HY49_SYNRA|nr:hypothetical protein BCR43DRAFT_559548 [Syncephalastrum racemosum]